MERRHTLVQEEYQSQKECKDMLKRILSLYRDGKNFTIVSNSGGKWLYLDNADPRNPVPAIKTKADWELDEKASKEYHLQYSKQIEQKKADKRKPQITKHQLPTSGYELYIAITNMLKKTDITEKDYIKMLIKIYETLSPKTQKPTGIFAMFYGRARTDETARFNQARIDEIIPLLRRMLGETQPDDSNNSKLKEAIKKYKNEHYPSLLQRMRL